MAIETIPFTTRGGVSNLKTIKGNYCIDIPDTKDGNLILTKAVRNHFNINGNINCKIGMDPFNFVDNDHHLSNIKDGNTLTIRMYDYAIRWFGQVFDTIEGHTYKCYFRFLEYHDIGNYAYPYIIMANDTWKESDGFGYGTYSTCEIKFNTDQYQSFEYVAISNQSIIGFSHYNTTTAGHYTTITDIMIIDVTEDGDISDPSYFIPFNYRILIAGDNICNYTGVHYSSAITGDTYYTDQMPYEFGKYGTDLIVSWEAYAEKEGTYLYIGTNYYDSDGNSMRGNGHREGLTTSWQKYYVTFKNDDYLIYGIKSFIVLFHLYDGEVSTIHLRNLRVGYKHRERGGNAFFDHVLREAPYREPFTVNIDTNTKFPIKIPSFIGNTHIFSESQIELLIPINEKGKNIINSMII